MGYVFVGMTAGAGAAAAAASAAGLDIGGFSASTFLTVAEMIAYGEDGGELAGNKYCG